MAKKLNCEVSSSHTLSVTVANGNKVISQSSCLGFCWEMNGEEFVADLRLLKLGGCDAVLGVDWMKEVSPISFDFNKMEVTFEKEGWRKTLVGSHKVGVCKMISRKRLHRMLKSKLAQVAQLFSIHTMESILKEQGEESHLAEAVDNNSHNPW